MSIKRKSVESRLLIPQFAGCRNVLVVIWSLATCTSHLRSRRWRCRLRLLKAQSGPLPSSTWLCFCGRYGNSLFSAAFRGRGPGRRRFTRARRLRPQVRTLQGCRQWGAIEQRSGRRAMLSRHESLTALEHVTAHSHLCSSGGVLFLADTKLSILLHRSSYV